MTYKLHEKVTTVGNCIGYKVEHDGRVLTIDEVIEHLNYLEKINKYYRTKYNELLDKTIKETRGELIIR